MNTAANYFCVHGRFPCNICGTKHYDECECYFCVSPEKQREYDEHKAERKRNRPLIEAQIKKLQDQIDLLRELL